MSRAADQRFPLRQFLLSRLPFPYSRRSNATLRILQAAANSSSFAIQNCYSLMNFNRSLRRLLNCVPDLIQFFTQFGKLLCVVTHADKSITRAFKFRSIDSRELSVHHKGTFVAIATASVQFSLHCGKTGPGRTAIAPPVTLFGPSLFSRSASARL